MESKNIKILSLGAEGGEAVIYLNITDMVFELNNEQFKTLEAAINNLADSMWFVYPLYIHPDFRIEIAKILNTLIDNSTKENSWSFENMKELWLTFIKKEWETQLEMKFINRFVQNVL